ncbi:HoxN/HupN/NixA family nickel/cobalt transporter [Prauserella oleivorans]|uniref:Nickel/cobalt efflux system n=2 Tax=Prauserella TaxID=142577 RepID=A0A318LSQ5_9PSEU|nr:HoxN/HupN/NixA family nickel/cobalt transporter [Prauserella flavalba]PXY25529.1 nickel transporter [Prauserella flavalba]
MTKPTVARAGPAPVPRAWRSIGGVAGFIVALNALGWGMLTFVVVPQHHALNGSTVFGFGLGVTAFALGARHAFDADHIAAIDNTTRALLSQGQRPLSVGFWFSLGHSTIVFALSTALAIGVRGLSGAVGDQTSTLRHTTSVLGSAVSGVFLYAIAITNLVTLVGILRVYRRMRRQAAGAADLDQQLDNRGFLNRLIKGIIKTVRKPWHIYPVGLLFGLGFDTATEIGLLVLAGGAAVSLPWYAILVLPALFTAGMTMFDTAEGVLMNVAYEWALIKPFRRVFYNIMVTALSVGGAFLIGTVQLASLLAQTLHFGSGPVAALAAFDLDYVGFGIVGLFVLVFVLALLLWRLYDSD